MVLGPSRFGRINGNYKIHETIAKGFFGRIYRVTDRNGDAFVAKIVPSKHRTFIENESKAMPAASDLAEQRVPCCHHYGKHGNNHVLVMDMLGESIWDLREKYEGFSLKSVLLLGIQIISCVEALHDRGFIHRDILLKNLLIGRRGNDRKSVYLVNYKLATRYQDRNGQPLSIVMGQRFLSLKDFASRQAHKREPESRRSDLESVAYLIVYLLKGLPWVRLPDTELTRIGQMKESITAVELCRDIPMEIKAFYCDVRRLEYEERPDYETLRSYLGAILSRYRYNTDVEFEWTASH